MDKILITGSTGFVGSCLTRHLVNLGYDVHVFTRQDSNKWRIRDLVSEITNHEVDLRDGSRIEKLIGDIRPDIVYHLATHGGFAFQKETSTIIESNLMGTINLLRACEKVGFRCFVNTGSSSEYGIKTKAMKETDTLEPIGDYGVSKLAATLFCKSEAITKDLPIVTLRLFSPYGPWDDPKRLIPYVIKSVLKGDSPKLSTPKSVRDFVFIDDVIKAYLKVIENSHFRGEVFNIGSGLQYSVGEVVSYILEITGNKVEPHWGTIGSQRPEPEIWVSDIELAKNSLGWQPLLSIQTGLERTIEWFETNLESY